jgi:hypothetical protein
MKKTLLLSLMLSTAPVAAFAADLAVEPAAPVVSTGGSYSGFVEVSGNVSNYEYWGDDYNPWTGFGAAAALAYKLDGNLSVGLDVQTISATPQEDNSEYYHVVNTFAGVHLDWTQDNYTLGGFAGVVLSNDYEGYYGDDYSIVAGGEGKFALADDVILSAQAGFFHQIKNAYYEMGTVGFGSVGVDYFPTDNLKLSASLGLMGGEVYADEDSASAVTYSLEAAYQFDDSPVSVFARVNGYHITNDYADGTNGTTLSVGARFNFDGESLKSQAAKVNTVRDLSVLSWLRLDD